MYLIYSIYLIIEKYYSDNFINFYNKAQIIHKNLIK